MIHIPQSGFLLLRRGVHMLSRDEIFFLKAMTVMSAVHFTTLRCTGCVMVARPSQFPSTEFSVVTEVAGSDYFVLSKMKPPPS